MAYKSEILAVSSSIPFQVALDAYKRGVFPWPVDEEFVFWYSPIRRGVLFLDKFNYDSVLGKKNPGLNITCVFNYLVADELKNARSYHIGKHGQTWLTQKLIDFYLQALLNDNFFSLTAFENNQPIGTIFCIRINNYVCAETMYSVRKGGSKYALMALVKYLQSCDIGFIDIQVLNSITQKFGGIEIPRKDFLDILKTYLKSEEPFPLNDFRIIVDEKVIHLSLD